MGVLCDYFAATSDEEAAAAIDRDGAPGGAVHGKGIDPVVQMGTLEELLTGRDFEEILDGDADVVAARDGGQRLVARLSTEVTDALAATTDERLAEVAVPWSQTEEFWGEGDPDVLGSFLRDLAGLARDARGRGQRLYCLVVV